MKDLTLIHNHIIAEVQLYQELPNVINNCIPTDSYVHLFFMGFKTLFSGKCFFVDRTKVCGGEKIIMKIVSISAFDLIENNLYTSQIFTLCGYSARPIGDGVILDVVKVKYPY